MLADDERFLISRVLNLTDFHSSGGLLIANPRPHALAASSAEYPELRETPAI
jgi:hypothetical protein